VGAERNAGQIGSRLDLVLQVKREPRGVGHRDNVASAPVRIGDLELVPLSDGTAVLPREFYVDLDWSVHLELLAPDGRIHMPIGCYLVRRGDRTVLLDAGLGARTTAWGRGGELPAQLASAGCEPGDIDLVVCTHLHLDHAGWLMHEGEPYFPNATVRFGAGDWKMFVTDADPTDHIRVAMLALDAAGRLEPMDGDMVALAPGITARATPGHTTGHYCLVLASGDERAFLLGDAVECPLQLTEPDFYALSDVDPDLARRTRETVWREVEGTTDVVAAAHFPDLQFGRVLTGEGRRWFTPA
jgi:glyoxylase-like metal-dependent hydrolase (beta-lactamase superfamily II)